MRRASPWRGTQACRPGAWRWGRAGRSVRPVPIAKRPRPCAHGLLGRPAAVWRCRTLAVTVAVRRACRARLLDGNAEARWLDPLLERGQTPGRLKARGLQRTDSPPVLAASRGRTRLARVAAPRRAARKAVAPVAPDWRHGRAPLAGDERSGTRLEDVRLPRTTADRAAAAQRGEEGCHLLAAVAAAAAPQEVRDFPVRAPLRRTWQRPDDRTVHEGARAMGGPAYRVRCTTHRAFPPAAEGSAAPDAAEARSRQTRDTPWTGSMGHGSATGEPTAPHRLTQVHTTPASVQEAPGTPPLQQALVAPDRAPRAPLGEAAALSSAWRVHRRDDQGIALRGPPRPRQGWQTQGEGADTLEQGAGDWEQQQGRCPQGPRSVAWWEQGGGQGSRPLMVAGDQHTGGTCPVRTCCPRAPHPGRRLRLPPRDQDQALAAAQTWVGPRGGHAAL